MKDVVECIDFNKAQIFRILKANGIALVTLRYTSDGMDPVFRDVLATGPKPKRGSAPKIALPEVEVTFRLPNCVDNPPDQRVPIGQAINALAAMLSEASSRIGRAKAR